ncbi:hypothetical protein EV421DRAFT_1745054 [Armillaria borealis]|uniref:Uncharacterized protein n=1 Tax=Armillaria borealis TaxID=47425 RepID=A0AA39MD41_9AGAR|nr:hypothetical protein EV421DRAFT_1745054 [Armillaria borealis]
MTWIMDDTSGLFQATSVDKFHLSTRMTRLKCMKISEILRISPRLIECVELHYDCPVWRVLQSIYWSSSSTVQVRAKDVIHIGNLRTFEDLRLANIGTQIYINISPHLGIRRQVSVIDVLERQWRIIAAGCMDPLTAKVSVSYWNDTIVCVVMTPLLCGYWQLIPSSVISLGPKIRQVPPFSCFSKNDMANAYLQWDLRVKTKMEQSPSTTENTKYEEWIIKRKCLDKRDRPDIPPIQGLARLQDEPVFQPESIGIDELDVVFKRRRVFIFHRPGLRVAAHAGNEITSRPHTHDHWIVGRLYSMVEIPRSESHVTVDDLWDGRELEEGENGMGNWDKFMLKHIASIWENKYYRQANPSISLHVPTPDRILAFQHALLESDQDTAMQRQLQSALEGDVAMKVATSSISASV